MPGFTDYCVTIKAEEEAEVVRLQPLCNYVVFGREVGENGYEHFQGFIQLKKRTTIKSLKSFAPTAHFEARMGTVEEAMQYCMKDGDFFQEGQVVDRPGQGTRSDLEAFYDDAKTGKDPVAMYADHTSAMIRYRRAYDDIRSTHAPRTRSPCQIHWLFGAPGSGKGSFVRSFCRSHQQNPYCKDPTNQWWCGYSNEKIIQIDEITSGVPYSVLLLAGDETPLRLPVKNGHAMFLGEIIFITSNLRPDQIYVTESNNDDRWGALLRRAAFYSVQRESVGRSSLARVLPASGWVRAPDLLKEFDVEVRDNPSVAASLCMPDE